MIKRKLCNILNKKLQEFTDLRISVVVTMGQEAMLLTDACAHYTGRL